MRCYRKQYQRRQSRQEMWSLRISMPDAMSSTFVQGGLTYKGVTRRRVCLGFDGVAGVVTVVTLRFNDETPGGPIAISYQLESPPAMACRQPATCNNHVARSTVCKAVTFL